jgi:hypothetical protein
MLLVKEQKKEKLPALTKKANSRVAPKTMQDTLLVQWSRPVTQNFKKIEEMKALCKTKDEGKINEAMKSMFKYIDALFLDRKNKEIDDFILLYLESNHFPFVMDTALLMKTKKVKEFLPHRPALVGHAKRNSSVSQQEIENTIPFVE